MTKKLVGLEDYSECEDRGEAGPGVIVLTKMSICENLKP